MAAVVLGPPAFERMLRDYLQQHPEVVVEAIDLYHQREEANADNHQRALLAERDNELRFDTRSPILCNPNGDVTVVEFFDYKCPFCRQLHPQIAPLLAAEPGVRLVLKEFAILGPESTAAARASIAVWMRTPTRFEAFHDAMMRATGRLDETTILRLAREAGIDADGLMLDMADPKIDRIIAEAIAGAQHRDQLGGKQLQEVGTGGRPQLATWSGGHTSFWRQALRHATET